MKTTVVSFACMLAMMTLLSSGCAPAPTPAPTSTPTPAPTALPTSTQTAAPEPAATLEPVVYPLSGPGSYHVGIRSNIAYEDPSRDGRKVKITIWYPAVQPQDSTSNEPVADAMPDLTRAPYPVILSSTKVGFIFAPHLVSHGFTYVGINGQDSKDHWGPWLTDYPLDIVFALNKIASNPLPGLETMLDTDQAGAMGYSFDGYTSLALSGARADPEFYLAQCRDANQVEPALPAWWVDYICNPIGGWDKLVERAGAAITASDDGLWKALTDERIRAVMPMAPEGAWLFGERGLAQVDRPILIIGATADEINIYNVEAAYIFEHLGTPDRTMISFINQGHMMIYDEAQVSVMKHFATAFLGYHLQGLDDYAAYFSADFVAQYRDLFPGVYSK